MQFGFAKVDVTPTEPVRLSGYGNRDKPLEGVDERLFARVMALQHGDGKIHLLVAVDTIGFPGYLTKKIHAQVEEKHQIARSHFVLCGTHSHTAPHLDLVNMMNVYAKPLTEKEKAATQRYGEAIAAQIVQACGEAIEDMQPGRMFTAEGKATFAENRRIIKDGICVGMAPNSNGLVDHSVPILKITDAAGKVVRGLVFNYACHCTTFTGTHNRVNGDWAGYAAKNLEESYPEAVALCTIGCGADANPQRATGRDLEVAQLQGKELSDEVERLGKGPMTEISAKLQSTFGYAGLPIEKRSLAEFKEKLNDRNPQVRTYAQRMLATQKRKGRLPESYPMPIQVWRFGDELTMVFLGGEVCVEYALRTKREITQGAVWVTAYANDVFGYVAPESMQTEGGYEVDFSMVFYNKPGRWASGTEDIIFRELHELLKGNGSAGPLSPEETVGSFTVPEGYSVEVVAAEPLIVDPVNFAIGPDGRLWVVEMSDYPRGANGDGQPGGRIKVLSDTDGDGRYDEAKLFLDHLSYPTGVFPWRDGALVSCVPDIFFAKDTDGDGRADEREVLFTNFSKDNPQHQMSGFTHGLDGWIYLACGDDNATIRCVKSGKEVSISGRDARIRPETGELEPVSGQSQYGRCRNDWNHWFGNTNSVPLLHFVIEDHYLARNPYVPAPSVRVAMTDPPVAPPVYPTSRTINRFNELFNANRFTSASSPILFRDTTLGPDVQGAAFICEPVHNLVSRLMLKPHGVTYRGSRHADEQTSEFFSSTDPWFRPVRLETGPDGALWVADMYRQVIEHSDYISEDWLVKLDLYAGNRQGRIYRIFRTDAPPASVPDMTKLSTDKLVQELGADNGWRRDTAQRLLVRRNDASVVPLLHALVVEDLRPLARLHALAVLEQMDQLSVETVEVAIGDQDPRIIAWAIKIAEPKFSSHPDLIDRLLSLTNHTDAHVRFQLALSLGQANHPDVGEALLRLALQYPDNPWIRAAVVSSSSQYAGPMLATLLHQTDKIDSRQQLVQDLTATTLGKDVAGGTMQIVRSILPAKATDELQDWQFTALASCISALARQSLSWDSVVSNNQQLAEAAHPLFVAAREAVADDSAPLDRRLVTVNLLGSEPAEREEDLELLEELLSPREPPALQKAAVHVLAQIHPADLAQRLLADWQSRGPQLQSEILAVLLSREEWVNTLIQALASGAVLSKDLGASSRGQLLRYPDPKVREKASAIFGENVSSSRQEVLDAYANVATLTGNAERGAKLFAKTCAVCHRHGNLGNDLGAKLASLQDKSASFLTTAILDPNRAVEGKYQSFSVLTQDGILRSGLITSETANSIELVDAQGKPYSILRIDIEELIGSGISFMPEGFEKELKPQDLADVMEFIRSDLDASSSGAQSDEPSASDSRLPPNEAAAPVTFAFGNKIAAIPGTIEAENFDEGEPNVAYSDQDEKNLGSEDYRGATQVDIEKRDDASGGHGIGWTKKGEWLIYTVLIKETGVYHLEIPVACDKQGGTFHLEFNGKDVTGPIKIPDTGGWNLLQTITKEGLQLNEGQQTMEMVMDTENEFGNVGDIDCLIFSAEVE